MRRSLSAVFVCVVLAGLVWAGSAQARIDRSYGDNGVASVLPSLPASWEDQHVLQLAAGRDGGTYALLRGQHCETSRYYCPWAYALVRYSGGGHLDLAFGGVGFYELPFKRQPVLAVDSAGRPVVAEDVEGTFTIVRLTPSGVPDLTFGGDGEVGIRCDCRNSNTRLIAGPRGTLTIAVPRAVYGAGRGNGRTGTTVGLVRLRGNGSFDKRFGAAGSVTVGLPNTAIFRAAATAKGGALYLAGAGCCKASRRGYVVRISAKGRYDRRFARASGRALRAVRRFGTSGQSVNAVLLRSRGRIDLLGSAGLDRGFVLRLNGRGARVRNFARKGLRGMPLPIDAAVRGSRGATVALSDTNLRGIGILVRMRFDGRMDRRFGRGPIPGSEGEGDNQIVSLAGRRVLALSLELRECRQYCPPEAQMIRYSE